MKLHRFQEKAVAQVRSHFASGLKRVGLQSCTGSGKTEMAIDMIKSALLKNKRVLFVVSSVELINQTYNRFLPHFPRLGVIRSNDKRRDYLAPISVMSVDTFVRRTKELSGKTVPEFEAASFMVIDEAHDCTSPKYVDLLNKWGDRPVVGLSATFQRIGKKGHTFWDQIYVASYGWQLLSDGLVPPLRIFAPKITYSLKGVKMQSGDYNQKELIDTMEADKNLYSTFEKEAIRHGADRKKSIIFCVNIDHVRSMVARAKSVGLHAIEYHSQLSAQNLKIAKKKLDYARTEGRPYCLVSVNKLSRGVDYPDLQIAFMLRPTQSEVLYYQQVGRLTRGTEPVTLIDLTTNSKKFKHPYDLHHPERYDISSVKRLEIEEVVLKSCPACSLVVAMKLPNCPECGFDFEADRIVKERKIRELENQELEELKFDNKTYREEFKKFSNKKKAIQEKYGNKYMFSKDWEYKELYKKNYQEMKKHLNELFNTIKSR